MGRVVLGRVVFGASCPDSERTRSARPRLSYPTGRFVLIYSVCRCTTNYKQKKIDHLKEIKLFNTFSVMKYD